MGVYRTKCEKMKNGMMDGTYCEFVMDSASDVSSLPTDCSPGSFAYVADYSKKYVLNTAKTWTESQKGA